jgi:hypothetical protein
MKYVSVQVDLGCLEYYSNLSILKNLKYALPMCIIYTQWN